MTLITPITSIADLLFRILKVDKRYGRLLIMAYADHKSITYKIKRKPYNVNILEARLWLDSWITNNKYSDCRYMAQYINGFVEEINQSFPDKETPSYEA